MARARLKKLHKDEVALLLKQKFKYKNSMEIPRVEKIVLNIGVGEAIQNIKALDHAMNDLMLISGQKPIVRKARKSIANFKLRQGMPIGCKVTLRGDRMYEFFDRLVNVALPRIRDFRGLSPKSFDGRGNFTFGIREQVIFPEINYDKIDKMRGMNITIATTAKTDEEGKQLLKELGMPFRE